MSTEMSWNSSYVFGYDNVSGWGDRYFFTYFTELGERSKTAVASEFTIFLVILILSVFANISIAVCVIRFPDMKTVTNSFVLNLAAADLLFAMSIPAVAYSRLQENWELGDIACRLVPYVQFVSGIVLLWTLALISIDRHRCIVVPPYRSKMSPNEASLFSAITWIFGTILFVPVLLWFREQPTRDGNVICTLVFPRSDDIDVSFFFIIPVLFFACLLPMTILVYNYQKIFCKIISTRNAWANTCVVSSNNTTQDSKKSRSKGRRQSELSVSDIFTPWPRKVSLSQQEEIRINKHIKVVRVLFLNVIVVLLMWLPITVIMFLIFLDGKRATDDFFLKSHHFIVTLIVAFLNTVVNPVLYGVLSDSFRTCLLKMMCGKRDHEKSTIIKENITPSSGRNHGSFKLPRKQSLINSVSEIPNDIV